MDKTDYATIPTKTPVRPGGYSPQENACLSTGSSMDTSSHRAGSNHNDTSGQSTDNYGEVVVQVLPVNENVEQGATQHGQTSHQPYSNRHFFPRVNGEELASFRAPSDLDPYERKTDNSLLLKSVWNHHGESPVNSEKTLLLSDVIILKDGTSLDSSEWSDSGCDDSTITTPTHPYCNTHYSPSQPPEFHQSTISGESICESGYKRNWMPPIFCGDVHIDSCNYRRTNCVHEEDEGRREEETFLETGLYKFKNCFPLHNVSDA